MQHIHPIQHRMVHRAEREARQGHRALVVWMTGLSGSGKSTLALDLERRLFDLDIRVALLDGDNVRSGINRNLGFSEADRTENIRRIAEVARLFADNGLVVLCTFISPTRAIRDLAREIIGTRDFMEVFVDAPLSVCEQRDVKGLYARARKGEIPGFTGIDAPFEPPATPDLHLRTDRTDPTICAETLLTAVLSRIQPIQA